MLPDKSTHCHHEDFQQAFHIAGILINIKWYALPPNNQLTEKDREWCDTNNERRVHNPFYTYANDDILKNIIIMV